MILSQASGPFPKENHASSPMRFILKSQHTHLGFTTWSGAKEHLLFKDSDDFVLVPGTGGHGGKTLTLNYTPPHTHTVPHSQQSSLLSLHLFCWDPASAWLTQQTFKCLNVVFKLWNAEDWHGSVSPLMTGLWFPALESPWPFSFGEEAHL